MNINDPGSYWVPESRLIISSNNEFNKALPAAVYNRPLVSAICFAVVDLFILDGVLAVEIKGSTPHPLKYYKKFYNYSAARKIELGNCFSIAYRGRGMMRPGLL